MLQRKMTFNIISDVHYQPVEEFTKHGSYTGRSIPCLIDFYPTDLKEADYLLIAGDLATDDIFEKALAKVKKETKGKFKDIFYVYGNHDYYDISYTKTVARKNKYVEKELDGNVILLGTTLWTPVPKVDEHAVRSRMNDFRAIPNWNIDEVRERYNEESSWLRARVKHYKDLGKKVIVMTHHVPRIELHPDFNRHEEWFAKQRKANPKLEDFWGYHASYYVTDHSCDDIKPDVWICGHHHTIPLDRTIDGVRYLRHTIGYSGDWYGWRPQLPPNTYYDFVFDTEK